MRDVADPGLPLVWVACPAGSVSGGPEALHQFCDSLRRHGVDAAMLYFELNSHTEVGRRRTTALSRVGATAEASRLAKAVAWIADAPAPTVYDEYDAPAWRAGPPAGGVLVVPEVHPSALELVPGSRRLVWWLSVDNAWRNGAELRDADYRIAGHLHQSDYARRFVELCGFGTSDPLTDYVNPRFHEETAAVGERSTIAFNPRKGRAFTQAVIDANPDLSFTPIENLDRPGVRSLLQRAAAYIDFGSHPGRDRLPREAALCGAPVIVADMGAAASQVDLPIPDRFKIRRRLTELPRIAQLLRQCLENPGSIAAEQDGLRSAIRNERPVFDAQVVRFVEQYVASAPSRAAGS